jgi:hypothetical protein
VKQLVKFGSENVQKKYSDKIIANSLVSIFEKITSKNYEDH